MRWLKKYFSLNKAFHICWIRLIPVLLNAYSATAQNETKVWYFGINAGLNFNNVPPSVLSNNTNTMGVSGSSICDNAGNLLFYTKGNTVYTNSNSVMANGNLINQSLGGNHQGPIILKQPGSNNLYYIFTSLSSAWSLLLGSQGAYYSIVDMSLAAGQGSVVVKNATLTTTEQSHHITATKHCNGVDYWIVYRDAVASNPQFRAYSLTSVGVSSVAVTSNAPTWSGINPYGSAKLSPNGRKLATSITFAGLVTIPSVFGFELFDFDNSTGSVSNPVALALPAQDVTWTFGCEFSPDGSKLYGSIITSGPSAPLNNNYRLLQWDLCAGTASAIVNSYAVIATSSLQPNDSYGNLQLASNGKIYVARHQQSYLGVIHNPNAYGAACNYIGNSQSISPNIASPCLPNFPGFYFQKPPQHGAFGTYTSNTAASCQTATFTLPGSVLGFNSSGCSATGYTIVGHQWNFGDPASGANNLSSQNNPVHIFSNPGTYTTSLIIYYNCGGGTDTLRQVVNVTQPCISISSQSITCASLGSATVTTLNNAGPYSFTWMPVTQTGTTATNLIPGVYTLNIQNLSTNSGFTYTISFPPLVPLTGSLLNTPSIPCNGVNSGSATVINLSGGSGNQFYNWTNGSSSFTSASTSSLTAGQWSVGVTDALTACQINSVFTITQPPAQTLNVVASSPSNCAGNAITFTASNSGGTPGNNPAYTFTWTNGPSTSSFTSIQNLPGNYIYSVSSRDGNNCIVSQTIGVDFVPNPTLSVSDVSICPLETGSLTVSGANSYTWLPFNSVGNVFSQSPAGSTQYTVLGTALSCTSQATASIVVKALPNPIINHNSPVCENKNLVFLVNAGSTAIWSGPQNYSSSLQSNTIANVQPIQSGIYSVTVTAVNSCTASASVSLTITSLPLFSIGPLSASICANTNSVLLNLSSPSPSLFPTSYTWFPNNGISSNTGSFVNAFPPSTKTYTVIGALNGCTNTANATVYVVPAPSLTLSLSSSSFCSNAFNGSPNTITLTSGGASTYTLLTPHFLSNPNPNGPSSSIYLTPPYQNTGPATATLLGSNGVCTLSLSATFSIIPNPTLTLNSYTPIICAGQSFTYTCSGANTFTWSSSTPGSSVYTTGNIAVTQPNINSVFSVFGGSLNCNSALQTTSITVNPLPTVTILPDPAKVCIGSTVELIATSNGTSFLWMPNLFLNTTNIQKVICTPSHHQTYTVIATLNNCSNTAVGSVSVMPLPQPFITGIKDKVCLYDLIRLNAQGGITYQWTCPNQQIYFGQNLEINAASMNLDGQYTLSISDANACVNHSTYPVTVHNLPNGYLLPKMNEFCVPYCNTFTFVANSQSGISQSGPWEMTTSLYTGNTFTACFNKEGTYTISGPISDEFGCKNKVELYVVGRPKPLATFYVTPQQPIEGLDEVQFISESSNSAVQSWQSTGGIWQYYSNQQHPTYVFEEAGEYGLMLIVKNQYNCEDTVMNVIKVESDFNAYVPNAFTPNGDGLNDTFFPIMRGVLRFDLQIFDRWGMLIFTSNNANHLWDGTYKGEDCKQDLYNYKLNVLNNRHEEKMYNGTITLYR